MSDVSFDVAAGETLGLVGESGCGKSTTGRAVALIHQPDSGSVQFDGTELTSLSRGELRQARTKIQMVFQDPISSLNPRRRVLDAVVEPLSVWGIGSKEERRAKARATLESVGIDPDDSGGRRPIEMSGGQCQRVSIARALMLEPTVLVCDEPVSALDVSVQAQILNLLDDLKRDRGLTMVFIAHDLAVVKNVSDRVAVMYLGKLCEVARPDDLYHRPEHPYTEALLTSIPEPDPGGGAQRQGHAGRGPALAHQSPVGVPVPHPLSLRPTEVRGRGAPDARHRPRPFRGLPLPAGHAPRPVVRRGRRRSDLPWLRRPPRRHRRPRHRRGASRHPTLGPRRLRYRPLRRPRPPATPATPGPPAPGERSPLWIDP